jgi:protein TonB
MGYQALLFCPDEKTARTVTQVLGDLEFSVETCIEPFAAVKKLMSEHFDALVVDCDNEQNATLLFKSARNSTSNQASLAVAVVEGQAGVAKAFRIGANLVLTKPINVEQAKGTLRVARGLLRKGDPGKPAAPAPPAAAAAPAAHAATAASPAKPAAAKPVLPTKPLGPVAPTAVSVPRPAAPPVPRPAVNPAPVAPVHAAVASSAPAVHDHDEDLLKIHANEAPAPPPAAPAVIPAFNEFGRANKLPAPTAPSVPAAPSIPVVAAEANSALKPAAHAASFSGGAASAPAPAREPQISHAEAVPAVPEADVSLDQPAAAAHTESSSQETTFTFGGANVPAESTSGSKKIFLGVAAVVLVAVGGYFAWTHFQGSESQSSNPTAVRPAPVAATQPAKPSAVPAQPAAITPSTSAPASSSLPATQAAPDVTLSTNSVADDDQPSSDKGTSASTKSALAAKASVAKPAPAPLVVKSGAAPITKPAAAPDTAAPSMIGIAMPGSSAPPPNVVGNEASAPKPILQTINISQGVSQGLLLKKVQPNYPSNALAMHVEGAVELTATISKTGSITSVKVVSGPPLLVHAAADAVKQWKYRPYLLNGEPVEIQTQIAVNFKLPH